jgi:hypothetical protein
MNGLYHLFILRVLFGMMRCEILMTTDAQEVYNTTATIRQQLHTMALSSSAAAEAAQQQQHHHQQQQQ